ncbi:hypothetical protein NSA56_01600 [Oceanobacillus caeni]|uniref:hypothetical protein n=1 Tax=Oceanobacillus caeni TaxID=405946 RepID=UPI002149A8BB|nr:hypothetical protein [Oceanobacillus caeni]MCR1833090.1 hypothetical protein [Oceanobacillus caeni]
MSNEKQVSIEDATVTILLEIDGIIHLVAMKKEKYEAVSMIAKTSTEKAIKTNATIGDLRKFLGVDK